MTNFLIRCFIKNAEDTKDPDVRSAYGKLSGTTGVVTNIILFAFKLFVGLVSGAVSVVADAFNNLSDAGSAVVTFVGFKLSETPPDEKHPFGHGRMEYISGVALGILILFAGWELGNLTMTIAIRRHQNCRVNHSKFVLFGELPWLNHV